MMNRKEALKDLKTLKEFFEEQSGAVPLSIEYAIEKLEQELCDDCISRKAVLEIIEREEFKGDALSEIEKLSPVIPQPKTGKWGICEDTNGIHGVYSIPDIKITAWSPLPEPYKAESE